MAHYSRHNPRSPLRKQEIDATLRALNKAESIISEDAASPYSDVGRAGMKALNATRYAIAEVEAISRAKENPRKRRNPASKADTVALALAKVDKRAGQVTGEDNSIAARAKRLRKSGYVVSGDPYGYGFPQQPKSIKAATILTEFKGGKVAPPSSSYSWSFDLNRELGNKAWEVYPVNSAATLIFKW